MKFGKLVKKRDPRTLSLKSILDTDALPSIPETFSPIDLSTVKFQMYGNDQYGDCAFAKEGNILTFWGKLKHGDAYEAPTLQEILDAYSAVTGFNPNDPSTDQGTILLDMLNYWRKHPMHGHWLAGYGEIQLQNTDLLDASIFLFQGADLGVQIPEHTMEDIEAGKKIFDVPSRHSSIIGGHDIPALTYDQDNYNVASWGEPYKMTKAFYYTYCDEAYALIGHEYMQKNKTIVNGVRINVLENYLKSLAA